MFLTNFGRSPNFATFRTRVPVRTSLTSQVTLLQIEADIAKRTVVLGQNPRSQRTEHLNKTLIYKAS
jgi:hypothetical protein